MQTIAGAACCCVAFRQQPRIRHTSCLIALWQHCRQSQIWLQWILVFILVHTRLSIWVCCCCRTPSILNGGDRWWRQRSRVCIFRYIVLCVWQTKYPWHGRCDIWWTRIVFAGWPSIVVRHSAKHTKHDIWRPCSRPDRSCLCCTESPYTRLHKYCALAFRLTSWSRVCSCFRYLCAIITQYPGHEQQQQQCTSVASQ